jgi:hypothetical protein
MISPPVDAFPLKQKKKKLPEMEAIRGRKEKRYLSSAQVTMGETALLLINASFSGGCVQARDFIDLMPNDTYTLVIIPEEESRLGCFEVNILARWVRMMRNGSVFGFIMTAPPEATENYIEFLKSKTDAGGVVN